MALINGKVVPMHYLINGFANDCYTSFGSYNVTILFKPQQAQNLLNYASLFKGFSISILLVIDFTDYLEKLNRFFGNVKVI